jgi:type IV secretory pathway TrbF-like protein
MQAVLERADESDMKGPKTTEELAPGQISGYLFAQRKWDERYGDVLTRARNWRLISFFVAIVALVQAIGMIAIAKQSHVVPYVVEVDKLGRALNEGPAEQASAVDPRIVRSSLADWLQRIRTVTNDAQVEQASINRIYAMVKADSAAFTFLNDYFRTNNPFVRGQSVTVTVEIHSYIPTSDKTYEISWTETERDVHGEVQRTENYTASVTVSINPPTDDQTIAVNPLGIYVTQIGWSKVL